jgi:D-alanyl-D-alanine carboxypeptidase
MELTTRQGNRSRSLRRIIATMAGVVSLVITAGPVSAQTPNPIRPGTAGPLQSTVDRLVADGVPGVLGLARRNSSAWHAVGGVRNLATGAPMQSFDRFRIGSITKSFVATVVLQLVGEGRLRLDDSVDHWLPGVIPNGGHITVHELLNQTSGLFDYLNGGDPTVMVPYFVNHDWDYVWKPLQLVAIATSHPPIFPPGTQWAYSNTNYIVLGLIVQAVTHDDPVSEIERRIIQPLELKSTSFPTTDPDIEGAHTHGYLTNVPPTSGSPSTFDATRLSPSWAWTAGAIVSTVDDLARFQRALFTGELLRPTQLRELETTVPALPGVDYGLGVFKIETPCGPAWGHNGDFIGYLSIALTSSDGSRQLVLSLNSDRILSPQTTNDFNAAIIAGYCGTAA